MKYFANLMALLFITFTSTISYAQNNTEIKLSYSDGKPPSVGLSKINTALHSIGVRVSTLPLPKEALPIIKTSRVKAINPQEVTKLLSIFSLHRGELLDEISKAGRKPEAHRGGYLSTSEVGVPPYPKVYDMKAMTVEVMTYLNKKFGKLHVNSSDNGIGIDEVMTLVSGGPWTWFFLLPDNVIGKLTLNNIELTGQAWRISYPGLIPHGAFLGTKHGLVVAYAHGPQNFVMRYADPSVKGAELLGSNFWIDFSNDEPKLLDVAITPGNQN